MRTLLLILSLWTALPALAQGPFDGYLKGNGVLDVVPAFSFLRATTYLGGNNQSFELPYQGNLLSLFAEYGLNKKVDLIANVPYVFTATQSGLQDGGLFVKYRPVYHNLGKAGYLGVLGGAGLSGPLSGYKPTAEGALGQRAVTLPARLILQWETPLGLFVNLTGGYTWRLDELHPDDIAEVRAQRPDFQPENPANFATGLVRVGFPSARFYVDGWVEFQHTRGGSDFQPDVVDLPQAYGVSYTQIGGTAYYSENGKNGFFISTAYIPNGRNVSRVLRLTAGMVFKFYTKYEGHYSP